MNTRNFFARSPYRLLLLAGAAAILAGGTERARAFETTVGDWQISLDTTLTSSVSVRTSDISPRFVGQVNGGQFLLPNADNGDLNFKSGDPVAALQRITTEFQGKHGDLGFFVRATGFYDPVINNNIDSFRYPFSTAAERDIGRDFRLLDAYVFASPVIGGHQFDVRVGNQALNWGESSFIQFGINSINPLDVTALRTPGSELRNGFLPIPVVDVKTSIIPDLTIEAFWQPIWTRTKLEPVGSFFGNNDTIVDGGNHGNLFSFVPDAYKAVYAVNLAKQDVFGGALPRSIDRHPTGLGEFGFALRKNVPAWGDAEFGLYFENYYSRTPFGSNRTGSSNISPPLFGLPNTTVLPTPFSATSINPYGFATKTYTATASYFADYPKDIHLIGFSWNFQAPGGVAIQGEYSNRLNQPIQLSASDLALAANGPAACELSISAVGAAAKYACAQTKIDPTILAAGGPFGFNQVINGWKRYPVSQIQTTATKLYGAQPGLYINSIALVGEIGFDYVHNFPRERGIFNTNFATDTSSVFNEAATVNTNTALQKKGLATQTSGAYTAEIIIDMPNLLPYGIDMRPVIALQHDFMGTSPVGVNIFQENTAAASFGLTFSYLQAWGLNVQYTNHFPVFDGGKFYGQIDRDFVSAALSYEF